MRMWRRWLARVATLVNFDSPPRPVDRVISEMMSATGARISRAEALTVPAVQRGRNLICSVATLPLVERDAQQRRVHSRLLKQIDPDVANVVTLAMTLEDLFFEGVAWWRILGFASEFPVSARRIDPARVSPDPPTGSTPLPSGLDPALGLVWIDGKPVSGTEVIRFDSPNPPVLVVGARAIRRAAIYDRSAERYAEDPRPSDYFTAAEHVEEPTDDEIRAELSRWRSLRRRHGTGYVPRWLQYHTVDSPNPQQLQLVELGRKAGLDLSNALGLDAEELGISTTSRTYANDVDRRQDRINDVLAPYIRALTDRLSMGDVTRRGHDVVVDLDNYLKSNPTERWTVYQIQHALGVTDAAEIRRREGWEPRAVEPPPAPPAPGGDDTGDEGEESVNASRMDTLRLSTMDDRESMHFFDVPVTQFKVDRQRRTIEGLALPYGVVASKYGLKYRFVRNSLKWTSVSRVKLLRDHDISNPIGVATNLTSVAAGLRAKFRVARGPEGDRALELAEDGVLDGLSVGVEIDTEKSEVDDDGVLNVHYAVLRETSLTAMPAFDDARVSKVAASKMDTGRTTMEECATCGQQHAPGACASTGQSDNSGGSGNNNGNGSDRSPAGMTLTREQLTTVLSRPGAWESLVGAQQQTRQQAQPAPAGGLTLSADQVDSLIRSGHLGALLGVPQLAPAPPAEQRQTVSPTAGRQATMTRVREELPYRFDRKGNLTRGRQYDFSTDLVNGSKGDGEALARAQRFVAEQFSDNSALTQLDIDTTDVAALNPNRQRPDLYVDQKEFQYPVWNALDKGTLTDSTPFVLPKFSTSSGLVANHTQGVEPTPGAHTATTQTITPSGTSGKVEITREAWDQGGNPQLSGIIWRQMVRAWLEALEAAGVAMLDALTPTGFTLTTAAIGTALTGELEGHLASLHFVRGGFRMRDFVIQVDLYKRLADAKDADGRKVYPVFGPTNTSGTTEPFFGGLNIAGLIGKPAWALAASGSVAASSYLFDRNDVHGWASAPNRLQFEYRVAYVDVAIWGYKAFACTDVTGVREVIYDPTV